MEMVPYWGILPQQGEETEAPVEVSYTLKRPRKTRVRRSAAARRRGAAVPAGQRRPAQLVGEAALDHTPAGEDLRLDGGHRLRSDRQAGPDQLRHPARQHQGQACAPSPRPTIG